MNTVNPNQVTIINQIAQELGIVIENILEDTEKFEQYYSMVDNDIVALNLKNLNLKDIPEKIGKLVELNNLNISKNLLNKMPVQIKELTKIAILDLSHNQISSIPEWIKELKFLRELHLENNQLFSLPHTIEELTLLRRLYIQSNNIHRLPVEILELKLLEEIHIDFRTTIKKSIKAILSNLESQGCRIFSDYNRR